MFGLRAHAARPGRDITVRPAVPDDAEAVASLARALSITDGGRRSHFSAEAFRRDGFGPDAAFQTTLAETDGRVVGYAVYYTGYDTDTATRGVYLADLFVVEAARRQGVGRALMAEVAAVCRRAGGRWMFWSVLKRNRGGRRFYRTMAHELKDITVCAAFGQTFDRLADMSGDRRG